jgi:hypothetical protein
LEGDSFLRRGTGRFEVRVPLLTVLFAIMGKWLVLACVLGGDFATLAKERIGEMVEVGEEEEVRVRRRRGAVAARVVLLLSVASVRVAEAASLELGSLEAKRPALFSNVGIADFPSSMLPPSALAGE